MITNRVRKSFGSRRKKNPKFTQTIGNVDFLSAFRHFGTHFAESFRMSKSSCMLDPTLSREMSSCPAIDLAEIRRSSKISSWIWWIISGVVTVVGLSRTRRITGGKISTVKLGHPAFDGGIRLCMFPYVSVRMTWISFGALPCRKRKPLWQLASAFCWNRARCLTCLLSASVRRKNLKFGTWTDPSSQRHIRFRHTTSESRSG